MAARYDSIICYHTMTEWLMRTQNDRVGSLMLVEVIYFYHCKTECAAFSQNCRIFWVDGARLF